MAKTQIWEGSRKIDMKGVARFSRLVAFSVALALAGCHAGLRLTKANVDEVSDGMTKKQVESILGPPTAIDTKDFVLLKTTTYIYRQGKDTVTIVFKEDKVQAKESTLVN
jgi:outer membrane protein assembly factor BamE (lipoprotein component of BamABCDE complex)